MKNRFLPSLAALGVLSMGLHAQNENQDPAEPADPPKPAAEPAAPQPADPPKPAAPPAPEPATPPPAARPPATPPPAVPPKPEPIPAPPDVAAPPDDAGKSDSGLAWKVLQEGTGTEKPGPTTKVEVHYTGWKTDGEMFDSSVQRGQPSTFPLNGVIKGWTEGLQLMVEGEKRRFWIPAALAYGENPGGGRPGGMLCFDVELLRIMRPHPTPEHVAAPPEDAIKTASGLATKVVNPGTGENKPKPLDNVRVHYTLWTTDGEMVASSLADGRPATFPLKRTIKGFTEALQMMVEGESRRIWIPEDLAYGADPPETAPKGMLVFEVELLKIYSN